MQKSRKGWLSGIAGKSFAVLSAAAIALPIIGMAQGLFIAPGDINSNTYVDIPVKIEQALDALETKAEVPTLQLVGELNEHYSPPVFSHRDSKPFDTDISFVEGTAALLAAGAFGVAGSYTGNAERREIEKLNAATQEKIDSRARELYGNEEEKYLAILPGRYDNSAGRLSMDDLGFLAVMENQTLDRLPDWIRAQAYQAQRDIALSHLHVNGLQNRVDFSLRDDFKLSSMETSARAEIFKLQRDGAWNIVNHELEIEDLSAAANRRTGRALAGGFAGGLVVGNRNAAAGAAMAVVLLAGAAVVGGCTYLSAKAVHDNFFRAHPELMPYREPGAPALASAKDQIIAARKGLTAEPQPQATPATLQMA